MRMLLCFVSVVWASHVRRQNFVARVPGCCAPAEILYEPLLWERQRSKRFAVDTVSRSALVLILPHAQDAGTAHHLRLASLAAMLLRSGGGFTRV